MRTKFLNRAISLLLCVLMLVTLGAPAAAAAEAVADTSDQEGVSDADGGGFTESAEAEEAATSEVSEPENKQDDVQDADQEVDGNTELTPDGDGDASATENPQETSEPDTADSGTAEALPEDPDPAVANAQDPVDDEKDDETSGEAEEGISAADIVMQIVGKVNEDGEEIIIRTIAEGKYVYKELLWGPSGKVSIHYIASSSSGSVSSGDGDALFCLQEHRSSLTTMTTDGLVATNSPDYWDNLDRDVKDAVSLILLYAPKRYTQLPSSAGYNYLDTARAYGYAAQILIWEYIGDRGTGNTQIPKRTLADTAHTLNSYADLLNMYPTVKNAYFALLDKVRAHNQIPADNGRTISLPSTASSYTCTLPDTNWRVASTSSNHVTASISGTTLTVRFNSAAVNGETVSVALDRNTVTDVMGNTVNCQTDAATWILPKYYGASLDTTYTQLFMGGTLVDPVSARINFKFDHKNMTLTKSSPNGDISGFRFKLYHDESGTSWYGVTDNSGHLYPTNDLWTTANTTAHPVRPFTNFEDGKYTIVEYLTGDQVDLLKPTSITITTTGHTYTFGTSDIVFNSGSSAWRLEEVTLAGISGGSGQMDIAVRNERYTKFELEKTSESVSVEGYRFKIFLWEERDPVTNAITRPSSVWFGVTDANGELQPSNSSWSTTATDVTPFTGFLDGKYDIVEVLTDEQADSVTPTSFSITTSTGTITFSTQVTYDDDGSQTGFMNEPGTNEWRVRKVQLTGIAGPSGFIHVTVDNETAEKFSLVKRTNESNKSGYRFKIEKTDNPTRTWYGVTDNDGNLIPANASWSTTAANVTRFFGFTDGKYVITESFSRSTSGRGTYQLTSLSIQTNGDSYTPSFTDNSSGTNAEYVSEEIELSGISGSDGFINIVALNQPTDLSLTIQKTIPGISAPDSRLAGWSFTVSRSLTSGTVARVTTDEYGIAQMANPSALSLNTTYYVTESTRDGYVAFGPGTTVYQQGQTPQLENVSSYTTVRIEEGTNVVKFTNTPLISITLKKTMTDGSSAEGYRFSVTGPQAVYEETSATTSSGIGVGGAILVHSEGVIKNTDKRPTTYYGASNAAGYVYQTNSSYQPIDANGNVINKEYLYQYDFLDNYVSGRFIFSEISDNIPDGYEIKSITIRIYNNGNLRYVKTVEGASIGRGRDTYQITDSLSLIAGDSIEVEFVNGPKTEHVAVYKTIPGVTAPSDLLYGWQFEVTERGSSEVILSGITDTSGKVQFTGYEGEDPELEIGKRYTFTEVGNIAADKWANFVPENTSKNILVTEGRTNTLTFTNIPKGTMTLSKDTTRDDMSKDGYCFIIENTTTGESWYCVTQTNGEAIQTNSSWVPDANLLTEFSGITDGTYTITEVLSQHGASDHVTMSAATVAITHTDGTTETLSFAGSEITVQANSDCVISGIAISNILNGSISITITNAPETTTVTVSKTMQGVTAPDSRLNDWDFAIYDWNGQYLGTFNTGTDNLGTVDIPNLWIGKTYTFREVEKAGYIPDENQKTLTVSANSAQNTVTFINRPLATMEINKATAADFSGSKADYCFQITRASTGQGGERTWYGISLANGQVYETDENFTVKTAANQTFTFEGLEDGTYSFTEKLSLHGASNHVKTTSVRVIVTNKDGTVIKNTTYTGSSITTAANGDCTVSGVELTNLVGGSVSVQFTNALGEAPFHVYKALNPAVTAPNASLAGWSFKVAASASDSATVLYTGTTDNTGDVVFDGYTKANPPKVAIGTVLYIKETGYTGSDSSVNTAYVQDNAWKQLTVTGNASLDAVTVTNQQKGILHLHKAFTEPGISLEGYCFMITGGGLTLYGKTDASGNVYGTNSSYATVAAANRDYDFKWFNNNTTYTIKEVLSRHGSSEYITLDSVTFDFSSNDFTKSGSDITVAANKDCSVTFNTTTQMVGGQTGEVTLTNKPITTSATVVKRIITQDGEITSPNALLGGWEFKVYDASNTLVFTGTTGTDGSLSVPDLWIGKQYTFVETPKTGYVADVSSRTITISETSSANVVTFINRPYGDMTLEKTAAANFTGSKANYCFKIENVTTGDTWYGISLASGQIYFTDSSYTVKAAADQVFTANGLQNGTYRITEVLSRKGTANIMETKSVTVTVTDKDGAATTTTYTGAQITTAANGDCIVSGVQLSNLVGARVSISFANGPMERPATIIKTMQGVSSPNALLQDWEFKVYDGNTLVCSGTTNNQGIFTTTNLVVGKTYRVEETVKAGYQPDENPKTITITKDGPNSVTFMNRPLGTMQITKATSADFIGTKDGFCFHIERAGTGSESGSDWYGISIADGSIYVTDASYTAVTVAADRVFTFEGLTDGTYSFTEVLSRHGASDHITAQSVRVVVTDKDGTVVKDTTYSGNSITTAANGDCTVSGVELTGLVGGTLSVTFTNANIKSPLTIVKTIPGVSKPDARYAGWIFTVRDSSNTIVYTGTTTSNGQIVTGDLYAGETYTVTETERVGYVPDENPKTITIDEDPANNVVEFVNRPLGSMEIVKVTSDGSSPADYCIKVENTTSITHQTWYGRSAEDGRFFVTNSSYASVAAADRNYVFSNMTAGTYSITEDLSNRPAGEHMEPTEITVTISNSGGSTTEYTYDESDIVAGAGNTYTVSGISLTQTLIIAGHVSIEVTNTPQTSHATVVKTIQGVTAPNDLLEDWEFTITDSDDNEIAVVYTDDEGVIVTGDILTIGETYTFTETAREGYVADVSAKTLTISSDPTENVVTFMNRPLGTMTIAKDTENGQKNGFRFIIENTTTNDKWYGISVADGRVYETDENFTEKAAANQTFTFAGLKNGTYKLTEVFDGSSMVDFSTKSVNIVLTDKNGTSTTIYRSGDDIEVLDNKNCVINNIPVTDIIGGSMSISFLNRKLFGSLKITKVVAGTATPIEGVVFAVYDSDDDTEVARGTTLADGTLTLEDLEFGSYYYKEISAPGCYILDDTEHPFTVDSETMLEQTVENAYLLIDVVIDKVNLEGTPLQGVEFVLEYSLNNGTSWAPVKSRAADAAPTVGTTATQGIGNDGKVVTDTNGHAEYIGLLDVDPATGNLIKYRLTETKTQDGYKLLATYVFDNVFDRDHGLNVDADGRVTGSLAFNYRVVNANMPTLPDTGGNGVLMPAFLGMLVMGMIATAGLACLLLRKKKETPTL